MHPSQPRTIDLLFGQDTLAVPDLQTKYCMQRCGIGFGFLPAQWLRDDIAAGRLVQKDVEEPKPDETLYLAWRAGEEGETRKWRRQRLQAAPPFERTLRIGQPGV